MMVGVRFAPVRRWRRRGMPRPDARALKAPFVWMGGDRPRVRLQGHLLMSKPKYRRCPSFGSSRSYSTGLALDVSTSAQASGQPRCRESVHPCLAPPQPPKFPRMLFRGGCGDAGGRICTRPFPLRRRTRLGTISWKKPAPALLSNVGRRPDIALLASPAHVLLRVSQHHPPRDRNTGERLGVDVPPRTRAIASQPDGRGPISFDGSSFGRATTGDP
ncbi:hypothetical protein C8Q78DRAFT_1024737 [Trametes maxima]|nr:hypothetical protein C8Q78DRAFT_1024737 [Trametes maxima]